MNTLNFSPRYSNASPAASQHRSAEGGAGVPVQQVAVDMPWEDVQEPGRLAGQRAQGEEGGEGIPGEQNHVVMFHPLPPHVPAHVVDIADQVNPAFLAAVVAIQYELAHPAQGPAPLNVLAPEGAAHEGAADHAARSRCDTDTLLCSGAIVVALGAVTSAIVGGVLAFTSEDPQTQYDGIMAFGVGLGIIGGWFGVSVCMNE